MDTVIDLENTFRNGNRAKAAAVRALGPDAEEGLHFVVSEIEGGRYTWEEVNAEPVYGSTDHIVREDLAEIEDIIEAQDSNDALVVTGESDDAQVENEEHASGVNSMVFIVAQASMPNDSATEKPKKATATPRVAREMRNGIKKPADMSGKCGQVWQACYDYMATHGKAPTSKDLASWVENNGLDWNKNNASIEFYCWRKFEGITAAKPAIVVNEVETPVPTLAEVHEALPQ